MTSELKDGKVIRKLDYMFGDKVAQVHSDGKETEFFYNASGLLVGKRQDEKVSLRAWDGHTLLSRDESVMVCEEGVGGGRLVLVSEPKGVKVCATDHLKNTLFIGAESHEKTAFGSGEERGTFNGQWFDRDLGGFMYSYRNYMPDVVRWMSSDPLGFPDGGNNNAFVKDPLTQIDAYGLLEMTTTDHGPTGWLQTPPITLENTNISVVCQLRYNKQMEAHGEEDESVTAIVLQNPEIILPAGGTPAQRQQITAMVLAQVRQNCHGYTLGVDGWIEPMTAGGSPFPSHNIEVLLEADGYDECVNEDRKPDAVTYGYDGPVPWSYPSHSALVKSYNANDEVENVTDMNSYHTSSVRGVAPGPDLLHSATGYGAVVKYWEK